MKNQKQERLEKFFHNKTTLEQLEYLRNTLNSLIRIRRSYERSRDAEYNNGEIRERTGIRGGRATRISANASGLYDQYCNVQEDFRIAFDIFQKKNL